MRPFSAIFDIVVGLPVSVFKDAVTIGGLVTGEEDSYIKKAMIKIDDDIKED